MKETSGTIVLVESSGLNCGVALLREGRVVSSFSHWTSNVHDRVLAELCSRMLSDNQLNFDDVDAIALSGGPGSFTGLRIGASFAKGLCLSGQPALMLLPTMQAQALYAGTLLGLTAGHHVRVLVGAQRGKCYVQDFNHEGLELATARLLDDADALLNQPASCTVIGPAAEAFNILPAGHPLARLHAEHLAPLAQQHFNAQRFCNVSDFVPIYVQDFVPNMAELKPLD